MRQQTGPVDWSRAVSTAQGLIKRGPIIPQDEALAAVHRLREVTVTAEEHVREVTGLGVGLPLREGEVVDRHGWVEAAAGGLSALTDGALPARPDGAMGSVMASSAGVQAGIVLAFLGSRVLGQYDPFGVDERGESGRLLLVAPNVVSVQRTLDVSAADFGMWVCLHECTHRLQFTGVDWLRGYFGEQVRTFLSGMEQDASTTLSRLPDALRSARKQDVTDGPIGLMELLQSPAQREVFDRLIALSTLLEGHADHVMDAAGPTVVPTVVTMRQRFNQRRRGGGLLDRILRTVLGVDAKVKQYAAGAAFTRHVVDAVGMERFNTIWTSPDTLPLRSEIADADAWLRRIDP